MSILETARFYYFHMHHYTGVPENPDKVVSTWVDYPNRLFDPEEGHLLYGHHLRMMRLAEKLGFDGVALNEHHNTMYSMTPAVSVMAGAVDGGRIRTLRQYFDSHYAARQMGVGA